MWFRNLLPYRFTSDWKMSPGTLEKRLAERPLRHCTGLTAQTQGWVSPRDDEQLVFSQGRQALFAYGTEKKLLPASVVKDAVKEKAAKQEARLGLKPGRKQLREMKEQVTAELLPKAFGRRQMTRAWIDGENGFLIVDAGNLKRGDELTSFLRETLGELPLEPLSTAKSPQACMTSWLATGKVPGAFELDQDAFLKGGDTDPATIRFAKHGLEGDDVRGHVKDGKRVQQLGLTWHDRIRCVLVDPGIVKRVRFELVEEQREAAEEEGGSADERFDADFTLMCGELSKLMADLVKALGGESK